MRCGNTSLHFALMQPSDASQDRLLCTRAGKFANADEICSLSSCRCFVCVQDDEAAANAAPETDDLLVCQFEKVAHVKDRWKIILKDGILRVNKKDFVFSRAIGEFDW